PARRSRGPRHRDRGPVARRALDGRVVDGGSRRRGSSYRREPAHPRDPLGEERVRRGPGFFITLPEFSIRPRRPRPATTGETRCGATPLRRLTAANGIATLRTGPKRATGPKGAPGSPGGTELAIGGAQATPVAARIAGGSALSVRGSLGT